MSKKIYLSKSFMVSDCKNKEEYLSKLYCLDFENYEYTDKDLKEIFKTYPYEYVGKYLTNDTGSITTKFYIDIDIDSSKISSDFKYNVDSESDFNTKKQYILDTIRTKSQDDCNEIYDIVYTDGSYYMDDGSYKYSFHIIFSNIMMDKVKASKELKDFKNYSIKVLGETLYNEINECIDGGIYAGHNFFRLPFGVCNKKKNPHKGYSSHIEKYLLTYMDDCKKIQLDTTTNASPRSVGTRESNLVFIDELDELFKEDDCDLEDEEKKEEEKKRKKQEEKQTKSLAIKFLALLNPEKRAKKYDDWIQLCFLIKNLGLDYKYFQLISSKVKEYNEESCIKIWEKYNPKDTEEKIGLTTLKKWAKEDNPEQFDVIEFGDIPTKILKSPTPYTLSEIYAKFNRGNIFYSRRYDWCVLNEQTKLWKLGYSDKKGDLLLKRISEYFQAPIKKRIHFLSNLDKIDKETAEIIKQFNQILISIQKPSFLNQIITMLSNELLEDDSIFDKFNSNENIFPFSDGMCIDFFNLKEGNYCIRKIKKDDYISVSCGYPLPDILQNPDKYEKDIEKVYKFISGLHTSEEMTESLLSMLSLPLYGRNINELFFIWSGSAGNGKGTLDVLYKKIFGAGGSGSSDLYREWNMSQYTCYEKSADGSNASMALSINARVIMTTEPNDNSSEENYKSYDLSIKSSTIKKISGGDCLTARFNHSNSPVSFRPKFIPMLQTNNIPTLSSIDGGVKRRIRIIEFPLKFRKIEDVKGRELDENERYGDEFFKTELETNNIYRDGLLYLMLKTIIKHKGKFFEASSFKERTTEYFEDQNPITEWFNQNFIRTEYKSKEYFTATDMWNIYQRDEGIDSFSKLKTQKKFGTYLGDVCNSAVVSKIKRYYCRKLTTEEQKQRLITE